MTQPIAYLASRYRSQGYFHSWRQRLGARLLEAFRINKMQEGMKAGLIEGSESRALASMPEDEQLAIIRLCYRFWWR